VIAGIVTLTHDRCNRLAFEAVLFANHDVTGSIRLWREHQ
jgi:hypothetical protein